SLHRRPGGARHRRRGRPAAGVPTRTRLGRTQARTPLHPAGTLDLPPRPRRPTRPPGVAVRPVDRPVHRLRRHQPRPTAQTPRLPRLPPAHRARPDEEGRGHPGLPVGCKRPVPASTFHPTLNLPHVRLVPHPVTAVTETGLVDATGAHHEADVLILSTGFPPTRFLANLEVRGIDKQFQLERQAEVAAKAVRRLETGPGYVDTDPRAQHRWVRWIDHQIAKKANAMES